MTRRIQQLHEEIVKAKKEEVKRKSASWPGFPAPAEPTGAADSGSGGGQEDAWLEVGKGGAKAVVNAPDPQRRVADSSVVRARVFCFFLSLRTSVGGDLRVGCFTCMA